MPVTPNQREFIRVKVTILVELRMGGNVVIQGDIENISFNGLLLRCEATLPEHTPCLVCILLDGGQGAPTIEAKGKVVRTESQQLAIQFHEIVGTESVHHLKNLVLYNSGTQADQVQAEFEAHVGLLPKS